MKKEDIQYNVMARMLESQEEQFGDLATKSRHDYLEQEETVNNLRAEIEHLKHEKKVAEDRHRVDLESAEYRSGVVLMRFIRPITRPLRRFRK